MFCFRTIDVSYNPCTVYSDMYMGYGLNCSLIHNTNAYLFHAIELPLTEHWYCITMSQSMVLNLRRLGVMLPVVEGISSATFNL